MPTMLCDVTESYNASCERRSGLRCSNSSSSVNDIPTILRSLGICILSLPARCGLHTTGSSSYFGVYLGRRLLACTLQQDVSEALDCEAAIAERRVASIHIAEKVA